MKRVSSCKFILDVRKYFAKFLLVIAMLAMAFTSKGQTTYYSYQNGNWEDIDTWTTDPSGTLSLNKAVPSTVDNVVILNGRTVSVNADGIEIVLLDIQDGAVLDLTSSVGHTFTTLQGQGILKLQSTLPSGNFSPFVSSGGGTIEYQSGSNFIFNGSTFNNLILNLTSTGIEATINTDFTVNGDLQIKRGTLIIGDATTRNVYVEGDLTVDANGRINVGPDEQRHNLYLRGDFTVNGAVTFTDRIAPNFLSISDTRVYVIFDNDYADQYLSINASAVFYRIGVNKGTDDTYTLHIDASNDSYFKLYGHNNTQTNSPGTPPNIANDNAVGLESGTLRLGANIIVPALASSNDYFAFGEGRNYAIDEDATLWIDGATVYTSSYIPPSQNAKAIMSVYGKLKITSGELIDNAWQGIGLRATGQMIVEDGTVNSTIIRTSAQSSGHRGAYIQTGGEVTIRRDISTSDGYSASFHLGYSTTSFIMSGGELNILRSTPTDGTYTQGRQFSFVLASAPENIQITGGAITIHVPDGRNAFFTSRGSFYNLNIVKEAPSAFEARVVEHPGSVIGTTTVNELVPALPVKVLNNLSLIDDAIFSTGIENVDVSVSGDFLIELGSTYTPGTNTTIFNGLAGQFFDNAGTVDGDLNNLTVSNSSILSISNDLVIGGDLDLESGIIFRDMGNSVDVEGNIVNSGVHESQAGGAIILSGTADQTIGGDGNGTFGNLWLNKATGNTSLIANTSISGNIRLGNISGVFNIGSYQLSLSSTSNIYDDLAGTGTNFSSTKMIQTNGLQSDAGLKLQFNSTVQKLFPIGVSGKYTRATLEFTSAPTQWGSVAISPVNSAHPHSTDANILDYYWRASSEGFTGIPVSSTRLRLYYNSGDVTGDVNSYLPGLYNPTSWSTFSTDKVSPVIQEILFDDIASPDGDFTAGEVAAFGSVETYYSVANGEWTSTATWSTSSTETIEPATPPTASSAVVIRTGNTVTISSGNDNQVVGSLQIQAGGTLDLTTTTGHNFGTIESNEISGNGTLRISSLVSPAQFPNGDFGDFLGDNGGTVEFYTSGAVNFNIPDNNASGDPISGYYNLTVNSGAGRTVTMPNTDLNVKGKFTKMGTGTANLNSINQRTLSVYGDFEVNQGIIQYFNDQAQSVNVYGDLIVNGGSSFIVRNAGTGVANILNIYGNLTNNGTFNLNRSSTLYCLAYFLGASNQSISGSGATTSFYRLYVDKGVDQSSTLTVNSDVFTLRTGLTPAPLHVLNGTIKFTNSALTTTLSAANALSIPSSGCLAVDGSTVNVGTSANDAGDLLLSGKLEVLSGTLNIGTIGNGNHNDIEYAAAGNPEIIIGGGTLNVNGQIRRSVSISTGALSYTQSGGTVNVYGNDRQVTRALLEVLNPGSVFSMSNGTINLINGGGTTFGDIYLQAESSSVSGGTISVGNAATVNTTFNLYFANPIWNLTVDGTTTAKSAYLRSYPVTIENNLTINGPSASLLNASELTVSIGGVLENTSTIADAAGSFQTTGDQVTRFIGSNSGGIISNGSNGLVFQFLEIDKDLISNQVIKSGASGLTVNNDLVINNGDLNTQTDISLLGNVYNYAKHSSSGGKLLFESSTSQQIVYGDENTDFGGIDINNALGLVSTISLSISGDLSFSAGFFDIGDRNLYFKSSATTTGYSGTNYIVTNGALSDAGVTKEYASSGEDFTFPIGVAGKYTPARINVTNTGGVSGTISAKPINSFHPAVQTGYGNDELQYYWNVTSTGFNSPTVTHQYTYLDTDVRGIEASYVSGRYINYEWLNNLIDNSGVVDDVNNSITHTDVSYIDGEFTAGLVDNFVTKPLLYSIASGSWYDGNSWSTSSGGAPYGDYPDGNPVIIENGYTITVSPFGAVADPNGAYAYSLDIEAGSTLDLLDTREHNFGHVKGGGTIKIAATSAGSFIFPGGYYNEFMNTPESTIEYSGTGTLPSSITSYQNITFSGIGTYKMIPAVNLLIKGDLLIDEGYLDNSNYNRSITVYGDWTSNVSGGFISGRGLVTFGGTSSTINSSGGETFYNLRINRTGGELTLASPVTVNRYLYLTRGFIFTDITNILSLSWTSANAVIGGSSLSFVDGPLSKNISVGSSFYFPVGNAGRYGRSRVFNVSTSGYWTTQYFNEAPLNRENLLAPLQLVSTNEYWTISGPASSTANILLRWDSSSDIIPTTALGRQKLRVAQYLAGNWTGVGNRVSDGGITSGTVQTTSPASTDGSELFTLGLDETATAIITGTDGEMCDNGSSLPVTVEFTGDGPWDFSYKINGGNITAVNSIGSTPYTILFEYDDLFPISGAGDYLIELHEVYDQYGEQGVTLSGDATLTLKVTPNPIISGNDRVMISSTEVYSVQDEPNEVYAWTVSLGTINGVSSNRSVTVDWSGTAGNGWVEVEVTNTLSGCSRIERYDVVVRDWPLISGNFNPFASSEEIYSTPSYAGHTYFWEVEGGTIKDGINDQSTVTVLWGKVAAGSITVTQTDTEAFSDSDSRLVTLTPTAQPIANDDNSVTEYETQVIIDVLANDTEIDEIPLIVSITSAPVQGIAVVNGDNTITFTPQAGFDGEMTFVYRVADVHDDWDEATVYVTVLPSGVTNHIPSAADDYAATEYETPVTVNVLANDTGIDDVPLTVSITTAPPSGTTLINGDNTITFTPAAGFDGDITFVYRVIDTHGEFDEATVYVTVLPSGVTNHIPSAADDYAATEYETAVTVPVLTNDTGIEDVPLTVSIVTAPASGTTLINGDNTITYTPAAGFDGDITFVYRVTDTHGEFDEATVYVTVLPNGVTNHIPTAADDYAATEYETPVTMNVLANDNGIEDVPLTVSITTAPPSGTTLINGDNTITYTPAAGFDGDITFVYRVTDTHGEFDEATVYVTVLPNGVTNHIPTAADDYAATEYETATTIAVLSNDTGIEDIPLTLTITSAPASGVAVVNGENTITFTPAAGFDGDITFVYRVTDTHGEFDEATVYVTVLPSGVTNHIPSAVDDYTATEYETAVTISVLTNDTGIEDLPLTLTITSAPASGVAVVNGDNTITFTPALGFDGDITFVYRVTDTHGEFDEATVYVTVLPSGVTNHIPSAADDYAATEYETATTIAVLSNDTGIDDVPLTLSITTAPASGTTLINGDNTITFTPTAGFDGDITFVYRVTDTHGEFDEATVYVTVLPNGVTNHIPTAADDYAATEYETPVTMNVLANDNGIEDVPLTVSITTAPASGTTLINGDNTITYTPAAGFDGDITFVYRVTDTHGEFDEATVYVTVLPNGVTNHIPTAADDYAATEYETAATIPVLTNDTGIEDLPLTLTITSAPASGVAVVNGENTITFTPAAGFDGDITFVYRVTDTHGEFDEATVYVTVLPSGVTNHIPSAVDDYTATEYETAVTISVLTNDTGIEDLPLTLTITSAPASGVAVVNGENTITFTPAAGFDGDITFVYRVTDTHGEFDEATVYVTVLPNGVTNHIPTAADDYAATEYEMATTIAVLSNDTGIDDVPLTLSITTAPASGTTLINGDNTITFTPAAGFDGDITFVYRVTDTHGEFDEATVYVTVLPNGVTNHIPTAADDYAATEYETATTIAVLSNDTGIEDLPLTLTITSAPASGVAVVNGDNTITYTPVAGFDGDITFVYRVTDTHGEFDEATVYVTVLPNGVTNHIPSASDDYVATEYETATTIAVLSNDTGIDDVPLTLSITTAPASGTTLINGDNTITFTPAAGFDGDITFVYRVTDTHGEFDEATVYVTVLPSGVTNHIPSAADDYAATEYETATTIAVLSNDTGIDDVPLTLSITTAPASGTTLINGDNTITFTPALGFDGDITFVYRVTDTHGEFDEATVYVTVLPSGVTNHIPSAVDDYAATEYEMATTIAVLSNDTGIDDVPLTLSITTAPASGTTLINGDNTITFTPALGFDGDITFVYRVTDTHGEFDEATVYVTVLPEGGENHVPVANDDDVETFMDTPIDIDILSNDTGLEDGFGSIEIVTNPINGTVTINEDNTINYAPLASFVGNDSFVYQLFDIHGESDQALVTIHVIQEFEEIIANDDQAELDKNSSITINVLNNDLGVESQQVSVTLIDNSYYGAAMVNADNTIDYVPNFNYYGLDSLTYEVCGEDNNCDQAKVRITVNDIIPDKLRIPEGFSPDGDKINDEFEIIGLEYFGRATIKVYNRWGNLVYKSDNYKNNWDGTSNTVSVGRTLPNGTYYYIIELVSSGKRYTGNVFLKR